MTAFTSDLWFGGAGGSGSASSLKTNQTTITADTTITSVNQIYKIDSSNNNITITLPTNANSGDTIKFHHEAFANNVVNIVNPAFPSSLFEIKNAVQTITCIYANFLNDPHWTIEGTAIDVSGNIASPFKEQIIQTAVASQFYLSNQALVGGKSLLIDQSILAAGQDLLAYTTSGTTIIQKFFSPSLNRTTLKKGVYSARVFANLENPPTSGDFSLFVDINVADINGNTTQNIAQDIDPLNNKKFPLNGDIEAFDFSYLPNSSLTINATDRLQFVVKFNSNADQSVRIYYGGSAQDSFIITPIDKKDQLTFDYFLRGNTNNEAAETPVASIRTPIGSGIYMWRNDDFLPNEGFVKCAFVGMLIGDPRYSDLYNFAVSNGLTTTNANEKGKFFISGSTFYSPDFRGYFVRSLGGVDPDSRTLASIQGDDFKSHTHTSGDEHRSETTNVDNGQDFFQGLSNVNAGFGFDNRTTSSTGGDETRPKNIALNFYIKY